jgi:hypothetical protein
MKKKIKIANTQLPPKASGSMKPYGVIKNKNSKPIFVLVPYDVWQKSKEAKKPSVTKTTSTGQKRTTKTKGNPWLTFAGTLALREDGLEYQKRLRSEWS